MTELSQLGPGDHLAFVWTDESELNRAVTSFIRAGVRRDDINLLLVSSDVARRYIGYLREEGVYVDSLAEKGDLVVEPIDELLQEEQVHLITTAVAEKLAALSKTVRQRRKHGLSIVGEIAGNLAKQGRYESALLLELFWDLTIPTWDTPISMTCPYEGIYPTSWLRDSRRCTPARSWSLTSGRSRLQATGA